MRTADSDAAIRIVYRLNHAKCAKSENQEDEYPNGGQRGAQLTAQHCVKSGSTVTRPGCVAAGSTTLSGMSSTGQIRTVAQVYVYPGYSTLEVGDDVALLRLSTRRSTWV